jgi:DNA-binding NtrC family response regulator/tetratricopeptide (TPR) repeat protein
MATLVADRFLCPAERSKRARAMDLATREWVTVTIEPAGTRAEQQVWSDACVLALDASSDTLIDFGCIGRDRRFEARATVPIGKSFGHDRRIACAVEWLEGPSLSSCRILRLTEMSDAAAQGWITQLARDARLKGFIPVALRLLDDESLAEDLPPLLAGRSVVLLNEGIAERRLSLAFLALQRAGARDACAVVRPPSPGGRLLAQAAEGRAAYEHRHASRRFTLRAGSFVPDGRALRILDEGRRLVDRGRHSQAERTMRAALAAFDRRGDIGHAAEAAARLAALLRHRGRLGDARALFDKAAEKFQKIGDARRAVGAAIYLGVAETDLYVLQAAESSLRAAYSAAAALSDSDLLLSCGVARARNLYWAEKPEEAMAVLDAVQPEAASAAAVRYWCLVARLRLASCEIQGAWAALVRARSVKLDDERADAEALMRTWEAAVQARLGDVDALSVHVGAGLAAAREAHRPLRALKHRLTLAEGLMDAGRRLRAHRLAGRFQTVARAAVPPLLKRRLDCVLERIGRNDSGPQRIVVPSARETLVRFAPARDGLGAADVGGVAALLSLFHDIDVEREALASAMVAIKRQTHALGAGIFGAAGSSAMQLAAAGSPNACIAQRCLDVGQPIEPDKTPAGVEGATPVRYAGRVIGAIAIRWNLEGPGRADHAMAFASAAAAASAPLVQVLLERQTATAVTEPTFDLIGVSPAIDDVRRAIARAANAPFPVLIEGESGSGKELVARAIHRAGLRRERPFSALNCAAMPEDLVDTELFGHSRGAFSGAAGERAGLFEAAANGTVFLDEVGELSARAQAKLLRALQEGEIRRIGENFTRPIDARLVAATNRPLAAEADAGRFRRDLLYRLDVIRISVPPLRDRIEDIPLLAARFWVLAAERIGSKAALGPGALAALARYDWPGNVRELQNVLTSLVVSAPARGVVGASALPAVIARTLTTPANESLEAARLKFEQRYVRAALARSAGHRGRAAASLGLSRQGFAKLMQRLHLDA